MPIYEYVCGQCGATFDELIRTASDEKTLRCPKCDAPQVTRKLSTFAAHAASAPTSPPPGCGSCAANGGGCPWAE